MHNQRNRRAAQARSPRSKHKAKRKQRPAKVFGAFPSDVAVPPHRGSSPRAIDFSPLVASPFALLSTGFVAPVAEPLMTLDAKADLSTADKRSAPSPNSQIARTAAPSVARNKPVKAKLVKAKLVRPKLAKAAKPRSALPLPERAEPLVVRGQAVVVYREGGLLWPLGQWLGARAEALWRRLGGVATPRLSHSRKAQSRKVQSRKARPRKSEPADQIQRLVAENDRLKAQLEALLAQQQARPQPVSLGAQESVKQHSP